MVSVHTPVRGSNRGSGKKKKEKKNRGSGNWARASPLGPPLGLLCHQDGKHLGLCQHLPVACGEAQIDK